MALHLVRHGRPLTSADARPDWPLDPAHIVDVALLRDSGAIPMRAHWYTSPERRAVETARALTDAKPRLVEDLREQTRPDSWIDGFGDLVEQSLRFSEIPPDRGWETAASVGDRLVSVVSTLPTNGDVVLVGHGIAWTILVARLTDLEPDVAAWRAMRFPDHCVVEDGRIVSGWSEWTSAK